MIIFNLILKNYFKLFNHNGIWYNEKWLLNIPYGNLSYKMKLIVDGIRYRQYQNDSKQLKIILNKEIKNWKYDKLIL